MVQSALPVFTAIALGMFFRKIKFLDAQAVSNLKKLVVNVTLPVVLFYAFATADYNASTIIQPVIIFLISCFTLSLGFLAVRLGLIKESIAPFFAAGFEVGMLGYALFTLLFPERSVSELAILDLGHTLFVFTIYKTCLTGQKRPQDILSDMVKTPILWALAIGAVLGATGGYNALVKLGVSGILDNLADFIGAPTAMLILLTIGYELTPKEIRIQEIFRLILLRLLTSGIFYAIAVLLNRTLLNGIIYEGTILLLCILPPPYIIPVFAKDPLQRSQASSAISVSTILTVIFFAVLSLFF